MSNWHFPERLWKICQWDFPLKFVYLTWIKNLYLQIIQLTNQFRDFTFWLHSIYSRSLTTERGSSHLFDLVHKSRSYLIWMWMAIPLGCCFPMPALPASSQWQKLWLAASALCGLVSMFKNFLSLSGNVFSFLIRLV